MPEISPELLVVYVKAEFTALDTDADGVMSKDDVKQLLRLLGVDAAAVDSKVNVSIDIIRKASRETGSSDICGQCSSRSSRFHESVAVS